MDRHAGLSTTQPVLLGRVASALRALYDAPVELGVADRVTDITASDYERSLVSNSPRSDQGRGSIHLVLGGAVKGRDFSGRPPVLADNGPDDVGQGRLLPTSGVDQQAATLARWFGMANAGMASVLSYISNYPAASRTLGFLYLSRAASKSGTIAISETTRAPAALRFNCTTTSITVPA